jgi:hypothetical protein
MDTDRAKEIVKSLADGIDPDTGITFPPDSPYQRADTVRALYAILEAAESGKKPNHARKPNLYPAVAEFAAAARLAPFRYSSLCGTARNEAAVVKSATPCGLKYWKHKKQRNSLFTKQYTASRISSAGYRFEDIAIDHGRTTGGITSRLVKLGLIEDKHINRSGSQANRPDAGMSRHSPDSAKTNEGNRPPQPTTNSPQPSSQPAIIEPDDCPF